MTDDDAHTLLRSESREYSDEFRPVFHQRRPPPGQFHRFLVPSLVSAIVLLLLALAAVTSKSSLSQSGTFGVSSVVPWEFDVVRDEKNYGLTHDQCEAAFQGLFKEVDRSVAWQQEHGKVTREYLDAQKWLSGTTRAIVYDGELFIHDVTEHDYPRSRMRASLHSLNRALAAAPEPLPNVEMALHDDDAQPPNLPNPYIAYTRRTDEPGWEGRWLMPDFGFYSWPEPGIGTFAEVRRKMRTIDDRIESLQDKIPKLLWRGNIKMDQNLRSGLVRAAAGKAWSDVHTLEWQSPEDMAANYVPIEDHCKWAFVMHTEGNSYSARLKYLLSCRSLVFAHKLRWLQPFQDLLVSSGEHQNYVEVQRDFSDLDEKMRYYLEHMDEAQKIADNGVRTFRDRYTTPAATACYWRRLIRGWANVSEPSELLGPDGKWRGVPWESVNLMQRLHWQPG